MKREIAYQHDLKMILQNRFPGCMVLRTDPTHLQGIPDLLILYKNHWAALEVKRTLDSSHQPNQDYYVKKMNEMSFASFICPENQEEVLNDLERAFNA